MRLSMGAGTTPISLGFEGRSRRSSACWGRWQAELPPDRLDRLLDRPVGGVQPPLVGVKPTQGRGHRRGGCEPRPGLVDTVQIVRDPLRLGRDERILLADQPPSSDPSPPRATTATEHGGEVPGGKSARVNPAVRAASGLRARHPLGARDEQPSTDARHHVRARALTDIPGQSHSLKAPTGPTHTTEPRGLPGPRITAVCPRRPATPRSHRPAGVAGG
jgi:hypothetical protein